MNGIVTDETGAVVGAAKVVVTDRDRGTTFRTVADGSGRFVVTALPPGNYSLVVEAPGFKKFQSGGFSVAVQEQRSIAAQLQVGDVTTTVEVEGSAALVCPAGTTTARTSTAAAWRTASGCCAR
ncbi:MAG: carboxypeptidase-like regulatory domain-containing protein [Betaproteobacteria bacterium]